jgi:glycosyltransferase involved in cell wall biosynthesis
MVSRLSIFHPPGVFSLKANPFGKDVANLELFQALARHGGFEQLDLLTVRPVAEADVASGLLDGHPSTTRLTAGVILNQGVPAAAGALLRGQPDLYDMAWLRRRTVGDRAYSLLGLIHTLGPPYMRQVLSMASVGPTHPWDGIICSSPSVHDAVVRMLGEWGDYLGERTGGKAPPLPLLPVVPLGVDGAAFARMADRPDARASRRAALGVGEDDILALWVGRLSFFEKAFPQPMFQALQRAAEATGAKVTFAMAGWFPNPEDRARYEAAARDHAPDVATHFLDGNDRTVLGELWAAGDIFMSLVDNIQETFGITPLEAMAAGLPVVASDWDGYRYTVRDGVEGFLIPTLGGPAGGLGSSMVQRHVMGIDTYQAYVGTVAQYTAVNVERAGQALAELIRSPDLRRRMGAAGRERVRTMFDWPQVARAYQAVLDELEQIRAGSSDPVVRRRENPVKGDPFGDFAGFATRTLDVDMPIRVRPGTSGADVLRMTGAIDGAFSGWRASLEECAQALDLVASSQARLVREVLVTFPMSRRRAVELGIMWMAKMGLIDWDA